MADWAHKKVDEILEEIDERLESEYIQTQKQVDKEFSDYMEQFEDEREQKRQELAKAAFAIWVTVRIMSGRKWANARDKIANTYVMGNQRAANVINGYTNGIFMLNRNFMAAVVDKVTGRRGTFGKFTTDNLKMLWGNNELWRKANIYVPKDQRWHKQKIKSAIRKGIENGESIPQIQKRLQKIGISDEVVAKRTARTAVTGAQNAGRMQTFREAEKAGIRMMKVWIATNDSRTRDTHRALDGDTIPVDEEFDNGLMYPGDTSTGDPAEYMNCRCTLGSEIEGTDDADIRDSFDESDFEVWVEDL